MRFSIIHLSAQTQKKKQKHECSIWKQDNMASFLYKLALTADQKAYSSIAIAEDYYNRI